MSITNFLKFSYWFDLRPGYFSDTAEKIFIAFLIMVFLGGIASIFFKRKGGFYKLFFQKLYSFCLSNFIVGLFLFFFRFELVPFLSARFWFGLWLIVMAIWLFFLIKPLKKIPEKIKEAQFNKEREKYLP